MNIDEMIAMELHTDVCVTPDLMCRVLKVPGGWIYCHDNCSECEYTPGTAVFVPEPAQ